MSSHRTSGSLDNGSLGALIDDAPDAVVVVDAHGIVRYANNAAVALLGHPCGELVGGPYDVIVPIDVADRHRDHHRAFMERPLARPMGRGLVLRARHREGHEIEVEIALVPLRPSPVDQDAYDEPLVAAFIRDVSVQRLLVSRLAATNELMTTALGGADRDRVLESAVALARRHLGGHVSWIGELADAEPDFLVVAADGEASAGDGAPRPADELVGAQVRLAHGRATFNDSALADRLDMAHIVAAPLTSQSAADPGSLGALGLARRAGSRPFEPIEREALHEFADAVAVTLELVDIRADIEQFRSVAEHDRIARDLHDTVIQRLFAISLRLESVLNLTDGLPRERITEAVDAMEGIIHEIRTTIFNLRHGSGTDRLGPRRSIADEVDAAAVVLGYSPALRLEGALDTLVPDAIAEVVPVVLREMLSNVARHARASAVEVVARADEHELSIVVTDDGVGPSGALDATGSGLGNLRHRARDLGGTFELLAGPSGGSVARWSVPIVGTEPTDR